VAPTHDFLGWLTVLHLYCKKARANVLRGCEKINLTNLSYFSVRYLLSNKILSCLNLLGGGYGIQKSQTTEHQYLATNLGVKVDNLHRIYIQIAYSET
jgi:hypothetical protein